jgi:hypothetical protein
MNNSAMIWTKHQKIFFKGTVKRLSAGTLFLLLLSQWFIRGWLQERLCLHIPPDTWVEGPMLPGMAWAIPWPAQIPYCGLVEKTTLTTGPHHARASPLDRLQSPPAHRCPARRSSSTAPPTRPPPGAVSALLSALTTRCPASGDSVTGAWPLARLRRSAPTVRGPPASWPLAARLSASLSQTWLELETKRKNIHKGNWLLYCANSVISFISYSNGWCLNC